MPDAGDPDAMVDAGVDSGDDAGEDSGVDAAIDLCASVTCPAMACRQAGTCNPLNGQCEYENEPDLTACASDNVPCTVDQCVAGVCTHTVRDCSSFNGPCTDGICNSISGACESVAKTNNTVCTDGNPCTLSDTCQGGVCASGPLRDCSASSFGECVVGACNPVSGNCVSQNRPGGTPCSDGAGCTEGDACSAGACVSGAFVCAQTCNQADCDVNHCANAEANMCSLSLEHNGSCDCGCQFEDGIDCGTDTDVCDFYGTMSGAPCPLSFYSDGDCDCTCDFSGQADAIDCATSPACVYDHTVSYKDGACPNSWDGDGECDCGCKFGSGPNVHADVDCP